MTLISHSTNLRDKLKCNVLDNITIPAQLVRFLCAITPCLDAFRCVKEAKKTIESLSDSKALDATLDIIEATCLSKNETTANFTCFGGIMSLYFYNSPDQDAKILARVKRYPKTIRNMIFNNEFYWFHNRPNFNSWISYIATADVDWEYTMQKQHITDMFKIGIEEVDGLYEPWVHR